MTTPSQRAREAAERFGNDFGLDAPTKACLAVVLDQFEAETLERAAKCAEAELVEISRTDPDETDETCNAIVSHIASEIRALIGERP